METLTDRLIRVLQNENTISDNNIETIFQTIFHFSINGKTFPIYFKKAFGKQIEQTLPHLPHLLTTNYHYQETTTLTTACLIRSGFQFLHDNPSKYLNQTQIITNTKHITDIHDGLTAFDNKFHQYCYKDFSNKAENIATVSLLDNLNTPTPHWWWTPKYPCTNN
jgi:hypothetical protein